LRLGVLGSALAPPAAAKRYLVNFRLKILPLLATIFRSFSGTGGTGWPSDVPPTLSLTSLFLSPPGISGTHFASPGLPLDATVSRCKLTGAGAGACVCV